MFYYVSDSIGKNLKREQRDEVGVFENKILCDSGALWSVGATLGTVNLI